MKPILIILLSAILLACNNKDVAMKETDTTPQIVLAGDTIYVREKDPNNLNGNGIFHLQALPVGPQLHLRLNDTSGHIRFSYRGQYLPNNQPVIVAGEWNSLFCTVDTTGVFGVEVSLKDQLGRESLKTLIIQSASAKRPIAALRWEIDPKDDKGNTFFLDASDCQQPYGKIMTYHYLINGKPVVSSAERVRYIFHEKGSFPVSLYVIDDLGQHSDTVHQIIDVL